MVTGLMDLMVDGLAPGVKKPRRTYQLIVVGAGPAGTAAAVCAASKGIDTLVIETGEAGQTEDRAQCIECFDNRAADPSGVAPEGRVDSAESQGQRFLLDLQPGLAVTGIHLESGSGGGHWQLETDQGRLLEAKSVILAPEIRQHRLNAHGDKALAEAGVHTCVNREGSAYAGEDLVVLVAEHSRTRRVQRTDDAARDGYNAAMLAIKFLDRAKR